MTDYSQFLATKARIVQPVGIDVSPDAIHPMLFPFQRAITRWALRKGRAAVFADTGLGKTFIQVEWARLIAARSLTVAPLSVARQTVREAIKIGVDIHYVREQSEVTGNGIFITNYEMIGAFDPAAFGAIVLDESSILKGLDGKTRRKLTTMFANTPYRLCCTATPAPNDIAEIANHAEFLGVMTRVEMLATFFVHDDSDWRIKGHATQAFYRWLASWAMSVRKPSDIGFDDDGYNLPPLDIQPIFIDTDYRPEGQLFFTGLKGITDRTKVRKTTLADRVTYAANLVNDNDDQWIVWCGLDDEQRALESAIPDCVSVAGKDSIEKKSTSIESFQDGRSRVLLTKPKIGGFGLNLQNAHRMVFVGLSDSWESYYQCVRRSWRFGQQYPVTAYIVLSEAEREIYENVKAKEIEAAKMADGLIEHVRDFERDELTGKGEGDYTYKMNEQSGHHWTMKLGDSCERLAEIESDSIGLSVFSPPFMSLYTYSPTDRDLGNSHDEQEFFEHFEFIIKELLRVTMPGRLVCCHVAQIPAMMVRDGYIGLKDFRGKTIQAFVDGGFIHHGEVVIDKDPQAQAIRTKSKALLFTQMHKDSSWSRPALADFILVFRKPGENENVIKPDITNNEWIEWARPIWYNIRESDTLQYRAAREDDDERHICPLQLGTIERCIRLWSNAGDTVLSPFAGIGSEGYTALRFGRKFIGIELKEAYWKVACKNLAEVTQRTVTLFDAAGIDLDNGRYTPSMEDEE